MTITISPFRGDMEATPDTVVQRTLAGDTRAVAYRGPSASGDALVQGELPGDSATLASTQASFSMFATNSFLFNTVLGGLIREENFDATPVVRWDSTLVTSLLEDMTAAPASTAGRSRTRAAGNATGPGVFAGGAITDQTGAGTGGGASGAWRWFFGATLGLTVTNIPGVWTEFAGGAEGQRFTTTGTWSVGVTNQITLQSALQVVLDGPALYFDSSAQHHRTTSGAAEVRLDTLVNAGPNTVVWTGSTGGVTSVLYSIGAASAGVAGRPMTVEAGDAGATGARSVGGVARFNAGDSAGSSGAHVAGANVEIVSGAPTDNGQQVGLIRIGVRQQAGPTDTWLGGFWMTANESRWFTDGSRAGMGLAAEGAANQYIFLRANDSGTGYVGLQADTITMQRGNPSLTTRVTWSTVAALVTCETPAAGGIRFQVAGGFNRFQFDLTGIRFYGGATVGQQTVTGSRLANPALASLLTALANTGIIIDGTTV